MTDVAMLARLLAQAEEEGAGLVTLRALIEEASEAGASRALERLGLSDASARNDISALRELLKAWRDAKISTRNAVLAWVMRIVLALLVVAMAARLGLTELLKP
ncbi:DUF6127 family protein [Sphingomonas montana]|uniref:DUF6127 family protein n=1 Tax=Sphingomonas montana TaxID=1843236 RepID=UPI00096C50CE|nr:DUF6127 family protein [Sphingomonas montana]